MGLVTGGIAAFTSLIGYYEVRRVQQRAQLIAHLTQYQPLFLSDRWTRVMYRVETINKEGSRWQRSILLLTHKRIALYPFNLDNADKAKALLTIQPGEIRGFWRPVKYMPGENTIWIHAEINGEWHILQIRLYRHDMVALVRALKEIVTPEQVTAYRRRRPYIHCDPVTAYPAKQALTGEWEIGQEIQLYLMPLYLVVLRDTHILAKIDLSQVQDIGALKRMEGGKPAGLIRFFVENELRAFALDDYETWAAYIATAAKRTLEEPLERKQKSKDDDEDWDDE